MTRSDILDTLNAYAARHPGEGETLARIFEVIAETHHDLTARRSAPAHITASCLIPQGESLLTIWHPYLKGWLQPGGHIDPGENVTQAALREALEETGMVCELMDPEPFDIDCLFVPANPRKREGDHWHIDFRYLMRPLRQAGQPELPTACVPFHALGEMTPDLARLACKLMRRLVMA